MAWLEDSIEEYKKLPTAGKIGIAAVGALVVGIAIYEKNKAASSASSPISGAAASGIAPTDTTGTSGTQSPFSMVGNVPLLPSGTNPLYDSQGNLIAFQPSPTPSPSPTPTPSPTSFSNGLLGPLVRIWQGGATPGGATLGASGAKTNWWYETPGGKQTLLNPQLYQNSQIIYGGQGRVWEKQANGQQILLTSGSTPQPAQSSQAGGTGNGPDGAGLFSTSKAMPTPSMPQLATHTMLPGETISGIAARLGVPVQDLQSANPNKSFTNGTILTIPGR